MSKHAGIAQKQSLCFKQKRHDITDAFKQIQFPVRSPQLARLLPSISSTSSLATFLNTRQNLMCLCRALFFHVALCSQRWLICGCAQLASDQHSNFVNGIFIFLLMFDLCFLNCQLHHDPNKKFLEMFMFAELFFTCT